MTNKILRPALAALFLLLIFVSGCKKNEDGLGANLLPDDSLLGLNRIDTISIESYTLLDDSIRMDNEPTVMLGSMNDPQFGKVKAGFYTQLRLSTNQPIFSIPGTTEVLGIDSVVLSLIYLGEQYGFNFPQEYEVYEISEQLYTDSLYYSNRVIETKATDLVLPESRTKRPAPGQSTIVGTDSLAPPQLRLKLNHEIGERIIANQGSDSLSTNTFTSFIKGLYVTVSDKYIPPGNGGVHLYNLVSANSKVTIYYTTVNKANQQEKHTYDLLINSNAQFFSKTTHDFTTGLPGLVAQLNGNHSLGQQFSYVQAGAGVKTRIRFPHLDKLNNDTMAINRAELIIPMELNTIYAPPGRIFALGRDAEENAYLLPDILEGDGHFNGFLDVINQQYRINISRWTQQVVYGSRDNTDIELVSNRAGSTVNRVVLFGPDNPDRQMKLVLHYTKF